MKKHKKLILTIIISTFILFLAGLSACGSYSDDDNSNGYLLDDYEGSLNTDELPPESPPSPLFPGPDVELFPWPADRPVEHLFTHEVIVWPELAFRPGPMQRNYDNNMITVLEFERILESLHQNGFILVDINSVWSEYTNEDGQQRMRRNVLMLPEGRKPLVFSFDDINFYEYMMGYGFMSRLIVGEDGEIWEIGTDPDGNEIITQGNTVVTILDRFVRENPDFSLHGAKGTLALTGFEGILGYRTQFDRNNDTPEARLFRMQEIALVRPVIDRLKETGWNFASHTYGHIWLDREPLEVVKADGERWLEEVGSLVGETKVFIYSYGSRLDGNDVWYTGPAQLFYIDLGFRLFASVGREPFTRVKPDVPAVMMDRMSVDGNTLRNRREQFMRFYDAAEIFDDRRPDFGNTW